jgi:hypothetical protein
MINSAPTNCLLTQLLRPQIKQSLVTLRLRWQQSVLQQLLARVAHYVCSENFYLSPSVVKIAIVILCIACFDLSLYRPQLRLCVF